MVLSCEHFPMGAFISGEFLQRLLPPIVTQRLEMQYSLPLISAFMAEVSLTSEWFAPSVGSKPGMPRAFFGRPPPSNDCFRGCFSLRRRVGFDRGIASLM